MITLKNYYVELKKQGIRKSNLPDVLQKGWEYIDRVTQDGNSTHAYQASDAIKRTVDLYLSKLNDFLRSTPKEAEKKPRESRNKPTIIKATKVTPRVRKSARKTTKVQQNSTSEKVEVITNELKLMKRFVQMHDKPKSRNQIRLFINAVQKAILEKRIRKTSKYAKEIMEIQHFLIKLHAEFKSDQELIKVVISEAKRTKLTQVVDKQAELNSVKLMRSYINLQGKLVSNLKAKNLLNRISSAIRLKKITTKDRYWRQIESISDKLKSFIKKNQGEGILMIPAKELNGLNGVLNSCGCRGDLRAAPSNHSNPIMRSTDVVNMNFEKIGFSGKWLELIGDPAFGFTTMIFGKPKMGKSYLAIDFSGYLARNHGTVLYVAREEGIDDTLQQKLKDKRVAHPDLYVSEFLPKDLSSYDFVFLDSVNKLGLSPTDLEKIKKEHPETSFVYIFQTTKLGNFRGGNEFQHDVDVVIEVPEKGKAVQFGRYNQGGEIDIFNQ